MTYEIQEIAPEPVIDKLTLRVDGEEIATARPRSSLFGGLPWLVSLNGPSLCVEVNSELHARRVLEWIGERMSPSPVVINGLNGLSEAKVGVTYQTNYNGGNRYRLGSDGKWEYNIPHRDGWNRCSNGVPYSGAYPLTAVR